MTKKKKPIMIKHIKGFGFEIEGGWEADRYNKFKTEVIKRPNGRDDVLMKGDGSVETDETKPGEIASPVFTDLTKAWGFMSHYYPDEVNQTCGFHIHISVDDGHYVELMEKRFYDEFLVWAENIGIKYKRRLPSTYAPRLEGQNSFCKKIFDPVSQSTGRGDRYTQINYCYAQHKTIENRMFPGCKDARTAFMLLTQYICFIEKFISTIKIETVKHELEVEYDFQESKTKKKIKDTGETICA